MVSPENKKELQSSQVFAETLSRVLGLHCDIPQDAEDYINTEFPNLSQTEIVLGQEAGPQQTLLSSTSPTITVSDSENPAASFSLRIFYFPQLAQPQEPYDRIINVAQLAGKITSDQATLIRRQVQRQIQEVKELQEPQALPAHNAPPTNQATPDLSHHSGAQRAMEKYRLDQIAKGKDIPPPQSNLAPPEESNIPAQALIEFAASESAYVSEESDVEPEIESFPTPETVSRIEPEQERQQIVATEKKQVGVPTPEELAQNPDLAPPTEVDSWTKTKMLAAVTMTPVACGLSGVLLVRAFDVSNFVMGVVRNAGLTTAGDINLLKVIGVPVALGVAAGLILRKRILNNRKKDFQEEQRKHRVKLHKFRNNSSQT